MTLTPAQKGQICSCFVCLFITYVNFRRDEQTLHPSNHLDENLNQGYTASWKIWLHYNRKFQQKCIFPEIFQPASWTVTVFIFFYKLLVAITFCFIIIIILRILIFYKRCITLNHERSTLILIIYQIDDTSSQKTIYLWPGTVTGKLPVYITCFTAHREDFINTLQSSSQIIHFMIWLKVIPGIIVIVLHYLTVPLSHYIKCLKASGISWNGWCQWFSHIVKLSIMTFYSLLLWKINFVQRKQYPVKAPLM